MRLLFLLLLPFLAFALQCGFEDVGGKQACVCRERNQMQIVDNSYCGACSCDTIEQVLQDFVNSAKNTSIFQFLQGFSLNVGGTPPPPIPVNLPPFVNTAIDIAGNPVMVSLLVAMKTAWIIFATILSYFIIFRR
ncbi:hypothetical protein [Hydrogenobacter hydrogenophilus]|uniref:Uncharacterized protein n=1 Tax=Hydrogenobacter hydrogenophilus TaxID=35835 RepID=A0A285P5L6_9AQUI|nr:hypothetical protein [Hydrogenobacter hydrogenophilus]SNZ16738.1 hypothetical protein SAMN06265353_1693 [Hydrogenobacter hydrogenophilus]